MRIKTVGNKRDQVILTVYNADTVALPIGAAACLNGLNGTSDGLAVVGAANAGANFTTGGGFEQLTLGVVCSPAGPYSSGIAASTYGEVVAFGFTPDIMFTSQTRSASTVSWNSITSFAAFTPIIPESIANGWQTAAVQSFRTDAISTGNVAAFTNYLNFAFMGQSFASYASSTSATSDARTAITTMIKGFVRFL